ncbi:ankyrin repeat domain-containing protein [Elizabethkingia meningoseptica]|uniref:ankyrin repeat domain-containing protein n=1 Tax=Elizabethkingia meningoseptica TaxID=238 RepID=UPI003AFB50E3
MMRVILFVLCFCILSNCHSQVREEEKTENKTMNITDAVKNNQLQLVEKMLKEEGAYVNTQNKNKQSLLLIATIAGAVDMAKLLTANGADVNLQDEKLDSAFLYAGASGQTELVKLYLAHGARFDVFNRYYGTALIPACERGHVETVKVLVNTKGFPINHVNRLGWTALMEAVILGNGGIKHQQTVQLLKDAGADLNIPDKDGKTPLQHARALGFDEIVKILES